MDEAQIAKWAAAIVTGLGGIGLGAVQLNRWFRSEKRQIAHDANRDEWEARDLARDKAKDERIAKLEERLDKTWQDSLDVRQKLAETTATCAVWESKVKHCEELLAVKTAALEGANNEIRLMGQMVLDRDEKIAFLTEQGGRDA